MTTSIHTMETNKKHIYQEDQGINRVINIITSYINTHLESYTWNQDKTSHSIPQLSPQSRSMPMAPHSTWMDTNRHSYKSFG